MSKKSIGWMKYPGRSLESHDIVMGKVKVNDKFYKILLFKFNLSNLNQPP